MVNDVAEIGGGATAMADVAEVLIADGYDVHVACPEGPLVDRVGRLGATWHRFDFAERRMLSEPASGRPRLPRAAALRERRRDGRRLADLADRVGASAVHTGALVPHLAAVAVRRRRPLVWHINQVHPSYLVAGPLPDAILGVSHAALEPLVWRAAARRRSAVVPNGIDTERFRPAHGTERKQARADLGLDDEPVVITVARLDRAKGIDTVVLAAAASSTHPVVVVVGDGPHRPDVPEATDVRMLGTRVDVDAVLRAADVFAFGSRWEAFGLAVGEASATGLPVVSTRAGGCAEVVSDGTTGVLVDVDDVAAMAGALDDLFGDPARRERLGAAGRRRVVERFDRADLDARLLPHYRRLVRS